MDIHEFLVPVPIDAKSHNHSHYQVLEMVDFERFDLIDAQSIVILGLAEYQVHIEAEDQSFSKIRNYFYQLSRSNWSKKIFDIGTILPGDTFEDSCFALHQVVHKIAETGATLIVLGGSQALSYIIYQALHIDLIKVGTIDIKLDIAGQYDDLSEDNHITKMILNEESRLLDYFNLGSQASYVAKEELDILEQLNFENIRLGKIVEDLAQAEPYLRELDLLSLDMNVMEHQSFGSTTKGTPNGFNAREICGLMRYAGLNEKLKVLHINNFLPEPTKIDCQLLAEVIWYFIEAQNNQKLDNDIQTYRVMLEEEELVFIKSNNSERWWIRIQVDEGERNIPCNHNDYLTALNGDYPDIWLKFFKKFY